MSFEADAREYAAELDYFVVRAEVPRGLLRASDHVAFGVTNADDHQRMVRKLTPESRRIAQTEVEGRKVAAAELYGRIMLLDVLWPVKWVEIIETGNRVSGIDHIEFVVPDLEDAGLTLSHRGIKYEEAFNPNHRWLSKVFDKTGPEFRLSDRSLEDIVTEEIRTRESNWIWHENS